MRRRKTGIGYGVSREVGAGVSRGAGAGAGPDNENVDDVPVMTLQSIRGN